MASELIDMASQFKGLPMEELIGAPLTAACNAQVKLAIATSDFIKTIGFFAPTDAALKADPNAIGGTRTAKFGFSRNTGGTSKEDVMLEVPLLAIVKVPALSITRVDITFDMEVKSSSASVESEDKSGKFSADASVGWGCFSLKVHVEGAVATHKENTRSSDNSAKYHVEVHAEDAGMPEGLARVLDIMNSAITAPPGKAVAPLPSRKLSLMFGHR
jgi:hypothetical protein